MLRRDLAVVLIAVVLVGCEQRSDLGGQKQVDACTGACAFDAGSDLSDAAPTRPDGRFTSAPPDQIPAFVQKLEGTWWGFVPEAYRIVDSVEPNAQFEVTFGPGKQSNQGTFHVVCLDGRSCNPFGLGSANPAGGTFTIDDLSLVPSARGTLAWNVSRGPEATPVEVTVPFDKMLRDEAGGPALTFDVGALYSTPQSGAVANVVLAFGSRPAGVGTQAADGAPTDAGTP